tara:strand:- start:16 stop:729 length:714 start_codon:yes stop_codon:yes gene_type:complete
MEKLYKFQLVFLYNFHSMNPYLVDKQFGLVCDDQYRTQHYINSVVDYKNYSGEPQKEAIDNSPLKNMELRKHSGGRQQEHVGKFGCVRYFDGRTCSHDDPIYVITGKNKAHMGVDLLASENTSIYSSVNGTAHLYSGMMSGYGKVISIEGKLKNLKTGEEEDVYVFYAHLSSIDIKDGEEVKIGDSLGRTGATGNGKNLPEGEHHLHLEILTQKWPNKNKGFSIRKPPLNYFKLTNP